MNINDLKGKTLDDELLSQLVEHVDALTARAETAEGKARTAQRESIEGRKQLKAERDAAFEKLGVSTLDELEAMPEAKGQAEAARQMQARLNKAERERAEAASALADLQGKYQKDRLALALEKAIASQPFIDAEDARVLLGARVKQEGDEFLFETEQGKLVPLADGAAFLAKTKGHLVKPPNPGATGSGYKAAHGATGAPNPWAKDGFNLTEQLRLEAQSPDIAAQLKAQAETA